MLIFFEIVISFFIALYFGAMSIGFEGKDSLLFFIYLTFHTIFMLWMGGSISKNRINKQRWGKWITK